MNKTEKILKAGETAKQVREYAKKIIKKNMRLVEIAEKIEDKIIELGGKPAFPTNLSIDDIAAHYTPSSEDKTLATGLLKVDFGVHISGYISDTAFSIDLENSEENKKLIQTAENALENAINKIKNSSSITTSEIGEEIQKTIESHGFSPIVNLSGHSMEEYDLHAGITIPNVKERREIPIEDGLYAIEPFVTSGTGKVYDGKPSGIYALIDTKTIRNPTARKIIEFAFEEYQSLPFCSRWIVKKFGPSAIFALKQLKENGNIHEYEQLIESSHEKVAQAEHTILITDKEKIITTA